MHSMRKTFGTLLVIVCTGLALASGTALADPPARVARLAYVQGPVSFAPAGEDEWVVGGINRPLVTGDRVWVDAGARTELQLGSAVVRLGAATNATVLNIDDRIAQFQVTQGTVSVNVRRLGPGEVLEIDTPNLALSIRRQGDYRIDVDPSGDSTAVGVRNGQADVYGEGAAYTISSGQWNRFYATGLAQRQYAALPAPDEFDQWASGRDRHPVGTGTARYVSPEVIGYDDLDNYGTWSSVPEYGPVWTPARVSADWAPYRDGRWSWIDPWGWTWVDAAPWGFAPYHYGRWAFVRERWCWVPGPRTVRPVYAPALVAFVGGANFSLSIAAGPAAGIAWFPLAPGEVYMPSYRASREYFTRVNVSNTQVSTTIVNNVYTNNTTNVTYRNRDVPHGITAVPSNVFVQSTPVAAAAVRVSAADIAKAPVAAAAPVAPSRTSVLGAAQTARVKPSAQVLTRDVVAKTKPPPAPVPFDTKEQALAKQPGRPLESTASASTRSEARADAPKIKLVTTSRQPEPAPRGPERAGPGKAPTTVARQPDARQPAADATPDRKEARKARDTSRPMDPSRSAQVTQPPDAQRAREANRSSVVARPPPDMARTREATRTPDPRGPESAVTTPEAQAARPQQSARQVQEARRDAQRTQAARPADQARPQAPTAPPPMVAARPPEKRPAEPGSEAAKGKPDKDKQHTGKQEAKKDDRKQDEERQRQAKGN